MLKRPAIMKKYLKLKTHQLIIVKAGVHSFAVVARQLRNLLLVARIVARSSNFLNYQANKNNSTNHKLLFIKNSKH